MRGLSCSLYTHEVVSNTYFTAIFFITVGLFSFFSFTLILSALAV